jgi:hypothetical protein
MYSDVLKKPNDPTESGGHVYGSRNSHHDNCAYAKTKSLARSTQACECYAVVKREFDQLLPLELAT